mmetsp:Transcript_26011/g.64416  ORF Transcript_26011/g.64416 Transcript_26011/m.64416 type:complete len:209 (-) Transcript_26011:351-977(-)
MRLLRLPHRLLRTASKLMTKTILTVGVLRLLQFSELAVALGMRRVSRYKLRLWWNRKTLRPRQHSIKSICYRTLYPLRHAARCKISLLQSGPYQRLPRNPSVANDNLCALSVAALLLVVSAAGVDFHGKSAEKLQNLKVSHWRLQLGHVARLLSQLGGNRQCRSLGLSAEAFRGFFFSWYRFRGRLLAIHLIDGSATFLSVAREVYLM